MTPRCAHTRGSGMWPLRGDVALWRAQPHGTGIWPLMGMRPHDVSVAIAWGCGPAMCPYPLHRDVLCSRGRLPSGQRFAELSPTRAHANPGAVCSRCLESLFNSQVHRQLGNGTGGGVRACVCVCTTSSCKPPVLGHSAGQRGGSVPCSTSTDGSGPQPERRCAPLPAHGPTLSHALRRSVPRRFSRQRLKRTKCSTRKICSVRK